MKLLSSLTKCIFVFLFLLIVTSKLAPAYAVYTCTGGGDHSGADWNPKTDCSSGIAGTHTNIGTFTVDTTISVTAYSGGSYGTLEIQATTVDISGTLSSNGKGYAGGNIGNGEGPGGGTYGPNMGSGGGHGGAGATMTGAGGVAYGSLTAPVTMGSGGSGSQYGTSYGGIGGGAIKITSTGLMTISGTVSSNGASPTGETWNAGGGGAGGSVYLTANTFAGAGSVTANGANGVAQGGCGGSCLSGGGGGGRVAVYHTTGTAPSFTLSVSAGTGGTGAESGTAFIEETTNHDLTIPVSNGRWNGSDRAYNFRNLTINNSVTFKSSGGNLLTISATGTTTIASGITITLEGSNTNNTDGRGVYLNLTGDVTIPATTVITASGKGYAGGTSGGDGAGPGRGTFVSGSGSGGSYGGLGKTGTGTSTVNSTYGSVTAPVDLGSGGSSTNNPSTAIGGAGGGAIRISTTGTLTISGTISANGSTPSTGSSWPYAAGSGAGGSIYISANSLAGSGTLSATGGDGYFGGSCGGSCYGGAGGGGRIAVYHTTGNAPSYTMSVAKGANLTGGENGTAFYLDTTNNDLIIPVSNGSWDGSSGPYTYRNLTINADVAFKSSNATLLTVTSTGTTTIASSVTVTLIGSYTNNSNGQGVFLNLTGNVTLPATSVITATGQGYAGGLSAANGSGTGGGTFVSGSGAGGGYGGQGKNGSHSSVGGSTYGSSTAPVDLGSGGSSTNNPLTAVGGAGGGAIKLATTGTLTILGSITANGAVASGETWQTAAGSGSGGSIYILANTFSGDGVLTANGGDGYPGGSCGGGCYGGAGGGGRIAIYSVTNSWTGTTLNAATAAAVGANGTGGGNGSVYLGGLPSVPTSLSQYKSDGSTSISTGTTTNETTTVLKFSMSHSDGTATLTPQVEVRTIGTSFSNSTTSSGTGLSYTGTPVTGSVTVSGLVDLSSYHWQSRVCDSSSNCSAWVSYGANSESDTDFGIFLNTNPNSPSISTSAANLKYTNNSFTNDNSPTLTFTQTDPDVDNTLLYRIQISTNADYSSPVVDYTSSLLSQGEKTFTVGQAAGTGLYSTGYLGQVLADGSYYWRVMTTDNSSATSSWTVASLLTTAFRISTTTPSANASSFSGVTSGSWKKTAPTISFTAGVDNSSGVYGYCIAIQESVVDVTPSVIDPATDAGLLAALDDGVSDTSCPYIITSNSINLSSISGLTFTNNKQYTFSIKTLNNAGSTFTNATSSTYFNVLNFKYDNVVPINVNAISGAGGTFSSIDDMYINWSTSNATDAASGILGFQYSLNDLSHWTGSLADSNTGENYVDFNMTQPFHFSTASDSGQMAIGENTVYFRIIDRAGNTSSAETYRTTIVSYGGAAPTFNGNASVTATPTTSTTNSYALSWSAASPSAGRTIASYYYMINTTPPATLSTITGNSALYIPTTSTSVSASALSGVVRGSNTVYVVVADDLGNYSPSSYLRTTFTLNSENPDPPINLAASDSSLKASSLWRGSVAWGAPDYQGTGNLSYIIQRSTDGSTWTTVATTSGTAYVDTVPSSSLYYWRVGSRDSSDASIASPSYANAVNLTPKGSYTEAPSLSSGPDISNLTTKKAKVSWSTSRSSDSKVAYGTTTGDYNDEEPSNSSQVTDHVINLTNLLPGTTYYYVAKWTDEDGNTGTSSEKTFTTEPSPSVSSVTESDISLTSGIITFTVKNASKASLYYGTTTSYGGAQTINTSTSETTYSVKLNNLTDGTQYHYKISLQDSEGSVYDFEDHTFSTLPSPKVSNISIQQVANTSQSTLYITWKSNTEISSIVSYYPEGQPSESRDDVMVALTKDHQTILRGLLPSTRYLLQVSGKDKVGNEALSSLISFTTATDTRAPELSNLRAEGGEVLQSQTNSQDVISQLIVSWNTDEPATSQVEFGEGTGSSYPQKTQEDSNLTLNHMVIISNLNPSKVYHLRALSKDKADNQGTSLDLVTITPKVTDSAFGLVITNLQDAFGLFGDNQ